MTGLRDTFAVIAVVAGVAGCCFGTDEQQQQASWNLKMEDVDDLIGRAKDPDTKAELEKLKVEWEAKYEALPPLSADKEKRSEAFGKLHKDTGKVLDEYKNEIEEVERVAKAEADKLAEAGKAEADKKAQANKDVVIRKIAGRWVGGGVDLTIDYGGSVQYKKTTGASEKSVTGPISRITEKEFVVKILGFESNFKIDSMPKDVDGELKMTIDGIELTRVEAP